ncbi:MAG: arylamine N-acetyltransferase [Acidobacteria bacterium]|nr:arylamine N-acetyltransferase [Acidobacteriota bacterium]
MNARDFPVKRYLERVGLENPPGADESGLKEIHAAQVFSVPFENLDIHLDRSISLKPEDLVDKMLMKKRGGYCFELNGLLHLALQALEFNVRPRLARVLYNRAQAGPLTHQVLIVTISGKEWLADCGFGGPGMRLPIPLVPDRPGEQYGERYRLRSDPNYGWVLQKESAGAFIDLYAFKDQVTLDADIEMSNHFTSTWPNSIFRLRRMCVLAKPWGRITLNDMELNFYRDGRSTGTILPPGLPYMKALAEHFGLILDFKYEDFIL